MLIALGLLVLDLPLTSLDVHCLHSFDNASILFHRRRCNWGMVGGVECSSDLCNMECNRVELWVVVSIDGLLGYSSALLNKI